MKACECSKWPGYTTNIRNVYLEKPYLTLDNKPTEFAGNTITSPNAWKWRRIVEHYTAKAMTFESDIFPALQGVANKLQEDGEAYHAGIWNNSSILPNLLCHVRQDGGWDLGIYQCSIEKPSRMCNLKNVAKTAYRREVWRAPTWSWASIVGPVSYDVPYNEGTKFLATVVDINTTPAGSDPFGQLESGTLQNKGRCIYTNFWGNLSLTGHDRAAPEAI